MSTTKFRTNAASNPRIRFSFDSAGSGGGGSGGGGGSANSEDAESIYLSAKSNLDEDADAIPKDASKLEDGILLTAKELEEQKKSEEYKTGLFGAMSVIICVVIGAGIFISPQETFTQVKSTGASLVIYAGLGIHTTFGAICFAELGTTFPVSGGDYAYIGEAFGSYLAFQYQAMSNLVFVPCVNAILAQTVGRYLLALICVSIHNSDDNPANKFSCGLEEDVKKWTEVGIGVFFVVVATIGNFFSSRYTKKLDEVFMIGKLLGCALIIVLGIYQLIGIAASKNYKFGIPLDFKVRAVKYDCSDDKTEVPEFTEREDNFKEILTHLNAVYYCSFSYLGWNYLNFITKDLRNPIRDLPLGICISVPLVTALYVMMNISYMAVLDRKQFACTKAMAYDTLNTVVGLKYEKEVGWIVVVLVIMAASGGLFGHMDASSKSTIAGAVNHHWPAVFQQVHVTQLSPIPAVAFQGFMTLIYMVIVGLLHPHAILMSCYCENTFSAIAVYGLIYMRFKRPDLKRPLKIFIGLPIFYCGCSFLLFLVPIVNVINEAIHMKEGARTGFYIQFFVVGVPILIISFSIIAYVLCISKRPCPECMNKTNRLLIKISRKLFRLQKQKQENHSDDHEHENETRIDKKRANPSQTTFNSKLLSL